MDKTNTDSREGEFFTFFFFCCWTLLVGLICNTQPYFYMPLEILHTGPLMVNGNNPGIKLLINELISNLYLFFLIFFLHILKYMEKY